MSTLLVALVGNPNVGKTSVFNRLTGMRQKVGNYPGVTVERKVGMVRGPFGRTLDLLDLPGTYSLRPCSQDEEITMRALQGSAGDRRPDLVVCVVDATNLERNLFLVTQVLGLGVPVICAVNMMDAAVAAGLTLDLPLLERELGCPVIPVSASTGEGFPILERALFDLESKNVQHSRLAWPWTVSQESDERYAAHVVSVYASLAPLCEQVVSASRDPSQPTLSDRVDAIVTNRWLGPPIFLLLLAVVFQSVFAWASPLMDLIDSGLGQLGTSIYNAMPEGPLRELVVSGVIAGVGAVLIFLPQILVLFFLLGLLEDTGYLARAAFLMDRVMRRVGLSGRSVVPLLSSYACAIPGIMAARTVDNQRDRLITILVAPLMTCSARLPVYALLIAAFVPDGRWHGVISYKAGALLSLYLMGTVSAFLAALVLRGTLARGAESGFFMELPPYRMPRFFDVAWRMFDRARLFIVRAGRVILPLSILLWFLASYPKPEPGTSAAETPSLAIEVSALGRLGHAIEPVIRPLGFDWKIGVALLSSFAAREVVVSTLSTLYNVQADGPTGDSLLRDKIKSDIDPRTGQHVFTPRVAASMAVFFVFALQCMSTIAVARRETNSWKWPAFMWVYMFVLAYGSALAVYQLGGLL